MQQNANTFDVNYFLHIFTEDTTLPKPYGRRDIKKDVVDADTVTKFKEC